VPKVELYAAIRRDARAGMSARAIGRKYRVGRRTIIKALASAWPEPRKKPPRRASKLDQFKPAIDEMLRADLDAPRKQRHTITRIYRRLIEEHQMRDVSYPVVRAYVAERRPTGFRCPAGRRRSSKATSMRSDCSAACRPGRSATTTSRPRSRRSSGSAVPVSCAI
jgi:hypothetical protein